DRSTEARPPRPGNEHQPSRKVRTTATEVARKLRGICQSEWVTQGEDRCCTRVRGIQPEAGRCLRKGIDSNVERWGDPGRRLIPTLLGHFQWGQRVYGAALRLQDGHTALSRNKNCSTHCKRSPS